MLKIVFSLFATGIILGSGPCLVSCGPILISYVAGTKKTLSGGLRSWFIFSVGRVLAYIVLGSIAGLAGAGLFRKFYWQASGYIIWFASGIFICLLGMLIYLGRENRFRACRFLNESLIQKDTKGLFTLGLLIGIFPCVPLVAVFSYIMMVSTHPMHGVLMSAAFGLGTIISPLFFLGMLAGAIPRLKILQDEKNLFVFQKICGGILFLLGIHIIIKTIMGYVKAV